ncbi:hypothetical protein GGF46_000166 [Coemansia sp. RSA 552]|nr:hypothetical protein GGF46_000166 [Coemansia sp. RSA 552]
MGTEQAVSAVDIARGKADDAAGSDPMLAINKWEVWAFHVLAPESEVAAQMAVPPVFKSVDSGEIGWNASLSTAPRNDNHADAGIYELFYRALDNLIDRALMPLSIVRFGFRQWIALDKPPDAVHKSGSDACGPDSLDDLPPTPISQTTPLPLHASQFVDASVSLDAGHTPTTTATAETPLPKCAMGVSVLRFTVSSSPQALLLQHYAHNVSYLWPISALDSVCRQVDGPASKDGLPTIAAVRMAPYGVPAKVVSVPLDHLGDAEENTIDAWSSLFGYPRTLLVDQSAKSSLLWIRIPSTDEPMLYPRRLAFVDVKATTALLGQSRPDSAELGSGQTAAVATANTNKEALDQEPQQETVAEPAKVMPADSEREEGEDDSEECEFDEEGEIADSTELPFDLNRVPPSEDLDAVVARLGSQTARSLEKSLSAIMDSMLHFQRELQAEEEAERLKQAALAKQNKGTKSSTASSKSSGTKPNGTRKRQRSNARNEGPNKARRGSASTKNSAKPDSSNEDIPLQALINVSTPQAPKQEPETGDNNATNIDSLFGDTSEIGLLGNSETGDAEVGGAQGDIGLDFGQMGDDLGLGLSIGDSMDSSGMGDFGASMFGVTDDDFNFFDSVPAAQQQQQQQQEQQEQEQQNQQEFVPILPQPIGPTAPQAPIGADSMDVDVTPNPSGGMFNGATSQAPLADAFAFGSGVDRSAELDMDDMLDDDGMFDSFFGGPSTTVAAASAADAVATSGTSVAEVKQEPDMSNVALSAAPAGMTTQILTVASGHDEKPMLIHALSSPPGVTSVFSGTETHVGSVDPLSSSMDVDLATPASIKMTPAPSADILTPVNTKGASDDPGPKNERPFIPEAPAPEAAKAQGSLPLASKGAAVVSRKPMPAVVRASTTPKPYCSISTPFDDIGTGNRTWLHDKSTATPQIPSSSSPDAGTLGEGPQYAPLMERSLNPVSWIRRVSARRMQHHAKARRKSGTAATFSVPTSVRRLRAWLTAYKAKLSYTKDFIPNSIRSVIKAAQEPECEAMASMAGADGAATETALGLANGASGLLGPIAEDSAMTRADSSVSNLQYSSLGAPAKDRHLDSHLPSFWNIINPHMKLPQPTHLQHTSGRVQMPGALQPSLGIGSLSTAAASPCSDDGGDNISFVTTMAISGCWVPMWMCVSGGVADLLVGESMTSGLVWPAAFGALSLAAKHRLLSEQASPSYKADIPLLGMQDADSRCSSESSAAAAKNLGARIGGLLMLGHSRQRLGAPVLSQPGEEKPIVSGALDASSRTLHMWVSQMQEANNWTGIVEMLGDWAACSSLLACVHGAASSTSVFATGKVPAVQRGDTNNGGAAWTSATLSSALLSFWGHDNTATGKQGNYRGDGTEQPPAATARGILSLAGLVSLGSEAAPSPTSKYRGYVVKKRRIAAQPSGLDGASSANSQGSFVVPSGPGTIEPLLDVHILVGTYGQEDISVAHSALRRRDAESIYVKRWRYTQKLARRAAHETRVANGEIEEAEEGEEREDGDLAEDGEGDLRPDVIEDWPDPDSYAMEAEDALRRVCISTSAASLRWWMQMQMRPIGASKDIRWAAFVPPYPQHNDDHDSNELVAEWCRDMSSAAEWYLGDVDSTYQAAHLGTHRPLGLHRNLDGVFTQLSENSGTSSLSGQQQLPPPTHWSSRLQYEAQRLGRCLAHGWYTASQQEQQQKEAGGGPAHPVGNAAAAAATLVLYMLVPHSHDLVPWLAMSQAALVAVHEFESALGSLIARTSRGVPSSTTTVSSHVSWPSLVVHPLPLDLLVQSYHGRKASAPQPYETAMAVYNRSPEFLQTAAAAPTHSSPAPVFSAPAGGAVDGAEADAFVRAAAATAAAVAAPSTRASDARQLIRRSGYFIHGDYQTATASVPGFAHRAFVISMPYTFPIDGSALAPATMSASQARRRNDIVVGEGSGNTMRARKASLGAAPVSSAYPAMAAEATQAEDPPANSATRALSPASRQQDSEAVVELDEVRVSFSVDNGAAGTTPASQGHRAASLCSQLLSHPLRSSDIVATLHCVYTDICLGSSSGGDRWLAVCWCDERGEYVEHDVFPVAGPGIGAEAAGRIWRGCTRYQALFGADLRVVLGEWRGMSATQAAAWHEYAAAWQMHAQAQRQHSIRLCVVSIGTCPEAGLRLQQRSQISGNAHDWPEPGAAAPAAGGGSSTAAAAATDRELQRQQWSLVLQGRQPHMDFASRTKGTIDESLGTTPAAAGRPQTGYLVLQQQQVPRVCTEPVVPCFCLQLLDDNASTDHLGNQQSPASSCPVPAAGAPGAQAVTRAILRQYYQLALLRRAERQAAGGCAAAVDAGTWPAHLLPLPVAVVEDIGQALRLI